MGFFDKIKAGLTKTREALSGTLGSVFSGFSEIDDDFYDELEESLILADLGVDTAVKATDLLRKRIREQHLKTTEEAKSALKEILVEMLNVGSTELNLSTTPSVILVIGVNGVGKTTSIGKLAGQMKSQGKKVILAAADTFRAAATEQLIEWAGRADVDIIHAQEGSDPASVVFDAVNAAKSRRADVLIVDTAGRLHNKKNLMEELKKINRVIEREYPGVYKETLVVLDANTGQNALVQAKLFMEAAPISGIVLTKMDGTAKGGIAVAIQSELGIPVKYIGVGERMDDLQKFNSDQYVRALFERQESANE